MERLDQGHLHLKLEVPRLTCLARESKTWASMVGGEHSSKELFEQCIICYSEHLHMKPATTLYFHHSNVTYVHHQ
jgi:hypothetical protein